MFVRRPIWCTWVWNPSWFVPMREDCRSCSSNQYVICWRSSRWFPCCEEVCLLFRPDCISTIVNLLFEFSVSLIASVLELAPLLKNWIVCCWLDREIGVGVFALLLVKSYRERIIKQPAANYAVSPAPLQLVSLDRSGAAGLGATWGGGKTEACMGKVPWGGAFRKDYC
jgi:hypothetical protein